MKNTILKFGGYSAILGGIIFIISHYFLQDIDMGTREIFGWISILASLSFVFFGIKHFRDQLNNGIITFGKALLIGLVISEIAGLVIGLLDIVYVTVINPDFSAEYIQHTLEGLKETLSVEEFAIQKAKLLEEMKMFDNPTFAGIFMFALIFSVGIIISLISALILQRK
jgi:hypothetical protein